MARRCAACDEPVAPEWVACPHCGRRIGGRVPVERVVPIVAAVGAGVTEALLLQAQDDAEAAGDHVRAAKLGQLRDLSKELFPLVADTLLPSRTFRPRGRTGTSPELAGEDAPRPPIRPRLYS